MSFLNTLEFKQSREGNYGAGALINDRCEESSGGMLTFPVSVRLHLI